MMKNQQDDIQTTPNDNDQTTLYTYPIFSQFSCLVYTILIFGTVIFLYDHEPSKSSSEIIILVFFHCLVCFFFLFLFWVFLHAQVSASTAKKFHLTSSVLK